MENILRLKTETVIQTSERASSFAIYDRLSFKVKRETQYVLPDYIWKHSGAVGFKFLKP